jgi:hypothetical protein
MKESKVSNKTIRKRHESESDSCLSVCEKYDNSSKCKSDKISNELSNILRQSKKEFTSTSSKYKRESSCKKESTSCEDDNIKEDICKLLEMIKCMNKEIKKLKNKKCDDNTTTDDISIKSNISCDKEELDCRLEKLEKGINILKDVVYRKC